MMGPCCPRRPCRCGDIQESIFHGLCRPGGSRYGRLYAPRGAARRQRSISVGQRRPVAGVSRVRASTAVTMTGGGMPADPGWSWCPGPLFNSSTALVPTGPCARNQLGNPISDPIDTAIIYGTRVSVNWGLGHIGCAFGQSCVGVRNDSFSVTSTDRSWFARRNIREIKPDIA